MPDEFPLRKPITLFDITPLMHDRSMEYPPPEIYPLKPTAAYDTYWRFAAERQKVFFARIADLPPPWTDDDIISRYRFTNCYRASDRVSQYLIRNVIYGKSRSETNEEVFFRTMLFKLFNKIETWELLEQKIGQLTWAAYSFSEYDKVLTNAMDSKQRIYSAAYIMPSASELGYDRKHRNHLKLIEMMMHQRVPEQLSQTRSMQEGFELLLSFPSIGDFLAYQFITDLNYSKLTNYTEMEFVVAGPGALDGISKCFSDTAGLNPPEIIRFMTDRQQAEFDRMGLVFRTLWGRKLQLIDCQNIFCEVSKYCRQRHPEILGIADRTKIKQKFRPALDSIKHWYPPKWRINSKIGTVLP